jgi:N-methylhydantoinase A
VTPTFTIGIDTGGTFTDSFVADSDGRHWTTKVPTTPHDLTVCFADAIAQSATTVGMDLGEFLLRSSVIRFSSTIGTNTILTRSGPKLGLLVTRGEESSLYGAAAGGLIYQFLSEGMVAGVEEQVADDGTVQRAPDGEEIAATVRGLLERGARILVVCLRNSVLDPSNERAVLSAIDGGYPRHYLGAVPTLLSTQVSVTPDDASRTSAAVVNAYMHKKLAVSLYRAEDDLRRETFRRPLLVVTADGTVTRVSKTRALSTYQSGPTAGVHASALLCEAHEVEAAITADVGGTSTDLGLVVGGRPVRRRSIDVSGVEVAQSSVELFSLAVGGGSICRVQDGKILVGPESAAALPGPACYGLGGRDATPTDAWLVLGYLDPDFFLGGRRVLKVEAAERALREHIATPLDITVEEAALAVKEEVEQAAVNGMTRMADRPSVQEALAGRLLSDLAMVAYGGGGGILLPSAARRLGIGKIFLSSLSSVFSAFGVSTFDVTHRYEARVAMGDKDKAGPVLDELVASALRDIRGEGFDQEAATLVLSAVADDGTVLFEDVQVSAAVAAMSRAGLASGTWITLALSASCQVAKPGLPSLGEVAAGKGSVAEAGERSVLTSDGRRTIPLYAWDRLSAGDRLAGPALIESSGSTYLIPGSTTCEIDRFGTAVLSREV